MSDIHVIMLHLVRSRAVIERCGTVLSSDDFNRPGEQFLGMIWEISKKWCDRNTSTMPQTYMDMEVNSELLPVQQEFSDDEIRSLYRFIDWIYAQPADALVVDHAMRLVQAFLDERRVKPMAAELSMAGAGDFTEALKKMQTEHTATRITARGSLEGIFTPKDFYVGKTPRRPTGVSFVDELFNGGTAPGELYGCIAPTGGGKTTLGAMLFAEFAKQQRHAAFFSYETEFAPQVTNSIYCYLAGVPRGALDHFDKSDVDPAHTKAIEEALERYGPWMDGFDMKKDTAVGVGCGGVPEIVTNVQMMANQGKNVELIVIDQMLSLVDSYVTRSSEDLSMRRQYMQLFTEQIREMCSRHHCCALILHQADNAFKKAPPYRKPTSGYAAEDKSFENNMHFCLGMGTRDDASRMSWLTAIKHREGPAAELVIQMDKDIPRINWDKEKFRYDATTKSFVVLDDGEFVDTSRELGSVSDIDSNRPKEEAEENEGFESVGAGELS